MRQEVLSICRRVSVVPDPQPRDCWGRFGGSLLGRAMQCAPLGWVLGCRKQRGIQSRGTDAKVLYITELNVGFTYRIVKDLAEEFSGTKEGISGHGEHGRYGNLITAEDTEGKGECPFTSLGARSLTIRN